MAPSKRVSGWAAVRHDPTRAPEIALLHALPLLSPSVARWNSQQPVTLTEEERARLARATVRRSVGLARRFGIIIGSSFYVGMAPAITVTYFEQILMILRVAAIYGRYPGQPARAAEILYLQGRYRALDQAEAALRAATTASPKKDRPTLRTALGETIRQLPSMLGLQQLRLSTLGEVTLNVLKVVAMLIPVISIPLWVYVNARTTRRFGQAAMKYYQQQRPEPVMHDLTLPNTPSRRRVVTTLITTAVILGALAAVVPLGHYSRVLPLGGVILAETGLALAMLRLLLLTRPGTPPLFQEGQLAAGQ
jgi:hypothetical protein